MSDDITLTITKTTLINESPVNTMSLTASSELNKLIEINDFRGIAKSLLNCQIPQEKEKGWKRILKDFRCINNFYKVLSQMSLKWSVSLSWLDYDYWQRILLGMNFIWNETGIGVIMPPLVERKALYYKAMWLQGFLFFVFSMCQTACVHYHSLLQFIR